MKLTFRVLGVLAIVLGVALGIAFGLGYAAGQGSPKTASGGLTTQQLQQLLGIQVGNAGTTGSGGGGTAATGRAGQSGTGPAAARFPAGKITAIDGNTVTVDTRAGAQKVNLSATTTFNKMSTGGRGDLRVGDTIIATGTAKPDGSSFDATAVSQVPQDLASLLDSGAGGGGTQGGGTPTGR